MDKRRKNETKSIKYKHTHYVPYRFSMLFPSTHTTLFWSPYDVILTLWTLYRRQNDVVCVLGCYLKYIISWEREFSTPTPLLSHFSHQTKHKGKYISLNNLWMNTTADGRHCRSKFQWSHSHKITICIKRQSISLNR